MTIDERLEKLGIQLPLASNPAANYTNCVRTGDLLFATSDFEEHPQVLNGASDLLVEVFEERGVHARSALGATSLRAGLPIVIESIFEVE